MKYETHPAADLFPMLGDDELRALADDIKANGQLEDIVLYEGKVLDGRNRLAACELAGVEPRTITIRFRSGESTPTEWVLSKNLHRRQLTKSQAAAVAVEALPMLEKEARERQVEAGRIHGNGQQLGQKVDQANRDQARRAASQAGQLLGVNRQYVSDAKRLAETAPETYERVKAGTLNLQQAKREARAEVAQRDPWTDRDRDLQARLERGDTIVLNANTDQRVISWAQPKGLIEYVDRSSPWGNPFVLDADGDRDQVCDAYAQHYLPHKPSLLKRVDGLRGKGLVCHCAPLRCHADALREMCQ